MIWGLIKSRRHVDEDVAYELNVKYDEMSVRARTELGRALLESGLREDRMLCSPCPMNNGLCDIECVHYEKGKHWIYNLYLSRLEDEWICAGGAVRDARCRLWRNG